MSTHLVSRRPFQVSARALLAAALLGAVAPAGSAGTWTKLAHNAPSKANLMLLLTDGTVMVAKNNGSTIGKGWMRLTPDSHGSYINGTWTTLASAIDTRLYYASEVLRDGRVICAGGEYGTGGPHAEIYDPQANTWTKVDPPPAIWNTATDTFFDSNSEMLPNGSVLFMPVGPHSFGVGLVYDPIANSWSNAGALKHGGSEDEAAWVKLPDDTILTIDSFSTHSERYFTNTNSWVNDNLIPVPVYDSIVGEMGGAVMLSTGQAFFLGATGHTVLYAPSGSLAKGIWTAGPDFPNGQGTPDAPACVLVTGHVLCATSNKPVSGNAFPSPTSFYEYDPVANAFTQVNAPVGMTDNTATFPTAMLALPDGSVLYSHMNTDVYDYVPSGAPLAAGKPTISSIVQNPDGTWHLEGTGLNGLNEGAVYGDDLQEYSNYPLVRLTDGGGVVRYARTFDWSSTGVMTGSAPVSTEFSTAGMPPGSYSLVVVAEGIASDAVPFTQPTLAGWTSLGSGLAGQLGVPLLTGSGTLIGGQPAELDLASAHPLAVAMLFVGTSNNPTPFKGGLLVPVPFLLTVPLSTDLPGSISFPFTWPTGLPSAFSIFFQYGIQDAAAVQGVALSNALQATTP